MVIMIAYALNLEIINRDIYIVFVVLTYKEWDSFMDQQSQWIE